MRVIWPHFLVNTFKISRLKFLTTSSRVPHHLARVPRRCIYPYFSCTPARRPAPCRTAPSRTTPPTRRSSSSSPSSTSSTATRSPASPPSPPTRASGPPPSPSGSAPTTTRYSRPRPASCPHSRFVQPSSLLQSSLITEQLSWAS